MTALLSVAGVACCVAMSMPQVHIVAYCGDLGFGAARGAEMLSLMLGMCVVSRLVSGWISDRIGGLRTLLLGSILQGVALLLFLPFTGLVSLYLVAQTGTVSYKMGVNMVLIAFVASVIGGMGSLVGAALGGFLVGIVSVSLQAYLPVDLRPYRDAFVFLAFIAFLLWRPQGLMTRRADMERV